MVNLLRISGILKSKDTLVLFIIPLLLVFFIDSIMSFVFPIRVEETLKENTILGIIMAASSVSGAICDLAFPVFLKDFSWKLKYVSGICLAMFFPLFNILGHEYQSYFYFFVAAIIWGVYYELITFSVHEYVSLEEGRELNKEWGFINSFVQFTRIAGPIIGALFLSIHSSILLLSCSFILLLGVIILILSIPVLPDRPAKVHSSLKKSYEIFKEIKYWGHISTKIYGIFLLGFIMVFVDSVFWTIGGLFSKSLFKETEGLEWVIVVLYSASTIIGATLSARKKLTESQHKYISLIMIVAGLMLALGYIFTGYYVLIPIIISSVLLGFASTLYDALCTVFIKSIKKDSRYFIGLIRMESSLAYIVGPILVGILADNFNYQYSFAITGIITVIVSLFVLLNLKKLPVLK